MTQPNGEATTEPGTGATGSAAAAYELTADGQKHEGFHHLDKAGLLKVTADLTAEITRLNSVIELQNNPVRWINGSALVESGISANTQYGTFHLNKDGLLLHTPDGQLNVFTTERPGDDTQ